MSQSDVTSAIADTPRLVAPELVDRSGGSLRLKGGACRVCQALSFPKAQVCAECLSLEIDDRALSAQGELYAFSRVHMAPQGWDVPYIIGYVDLPEGLRVLAHIDEANGAPRIGDTVRLGEGRVGTDAKGGALTSYVFAPVNGATA
ncbi:MAG: bnsA [Hyphomicrobiales bacterium]|nr:bnsA [Hyphomicrobiales bacterium]